jgi:hypothetical protein
MTGAAHLRRGRLAEAAACHRTALDLARNASYRRGEVAALAGLAAVSG